MCLARRNVYLCVLIYTLFSCGSTRTTPNTASLLTFNTALDPKIPNYAKRRTETAEAIKEIDADVVCLQEVWFSDDLRNILNVNDADIYPHSFSDLHETDGVLLAAPVTAPCLNPAFLSTVYPCFYENCIQFADDGVRSLQCAIQQCHILRDLDQQCLSCLAIAGVADLSNRCLTPGIQVNEPGVLMLSKYPLTNVRIEKYVEDDVTLFAPRAYIAAEIEGLGTVVCTHTTSNGLKDVYLEGNLLEMYESWTEQSLDEMKTLVAAMKDESKVVIMGDLNAGPTLDEHDIIGEIEGSYDYLIDNGYEATYSLTGYKCTYCSDNALAFGTAGDKIIDHVLLKNIIPAQLSTTRVFDEDPDNTISDHYGILARVFKNPSTNN